MLGLFKAIMGAASNVADGGGFADASAFTFDPAAVLAVGNTVFSNGDLTIVGGAYGNYAGAKGLGAMDSGVYYLEVTLRSGFAAELAYAGVMPKTSSLNAPSPGTVPAGGAQVGVDVITDVVVGIGYNSSTGHVVIAKDGVGVVDTTITPTADMTFFATTYHETVVGEATLNVGATAFVHTPIEA